MLSVAKNTRLPFHCVLLGLQDPEQTSQFSKLAKTTDPDPVSPMP